MPSLPDPWLHPDAMTDAERAALAAVGVPTDWLGRLRLETLAATECLAHFGEVLASLPPLEDDAPAEEG